MNWEELWDEEKRKEVWSAKRDPFVGDWVKEVKAEGDLNLEEKRSLLTYAGMLREDNARLEKKLEALRSELRFFESLEVNLEAIKTKDIVKQFRKVLGDE